MHYNNHKTFTCIVYFLACIQASTWIQNNVQQHLKLRCNAKTYNNLNFNYMLLLSILLISNYISKWKNIDGVVIVSKHHDNQINMNCQSIFELRSFHKTHNWKASFVFHTTQNHDNKDFHQLENLNKCSFKITLKVKWDYI
jgi:hypothetical protein